MRMPAYPYKPEPDSQRAAWDDYRAREIAAPAMVSALEESSQLASYFKLMIRHWRPLALAAAVGCLLGIILTLVLPPSYRVKTSIEIQNINGDFLNMKQARPVSDDASGTDALIDLATQIEVLQSASLANATKEAMKQIGLKKEWAARPSSLGSFLRSGNRLLSDRVLDTMAEKIKVRAVAQTRLISIQVDAPNPMLAADFANTLVTEYIHQTIRARSQMMEGAEEATRSQVVEMRRKLAASEQALAQYAARYGLVYTSERQTISDDRLRQVQSDLLHARTDLVEKQARRSMAQQAKADSLADVEKDPDLRELRSRLVDLRRQEAELRTVYKPTYSEVLKVKAQADTIEDALTQARARVVGRVMDEYKESSQKEQLLSNAYQDAVAQAAAQSQNAVQYDILKREADANMTAYQDMLAKVKELALGAAFRTSNVRIVDPAQPPTRQQSPLLALNMVLGVFSGLSFSFLYLLVSEHNNPSLRHPGEATMRLGIPELAAIPRLTESFTQFLPLPPSSQRPDAESGLSVIHDHDRDAELPNADAFRTLVTSILFADPRGEHPQVIVVTSTSARDGKTTVSSNMAIALARAGKRVLLVDGDLRKPNLHRRFSLPNMIGLGNLLQHGCDHTDAQFAVMSTSISRLSVLPSGSFTAAPADLLFQPNLHSIMNSYRQHFDMIVIDSPPLIGLPDARLLGRASDGVVLVARANKTSRTAILTACHRLGLDHSRVLGLVLNDWNGQESPYPA